MNILTDEEIFKCLPDEESNMEFARAIESAVLSNLAEQSDEEPVAWQWKSGHLVYDKAALMPSTRHLATPLYTETQYIAAQQRTAEACAKAVERLTGGDGLCADDGVWIHDCAEAIRNGDWREYL